MVAVDSRKEDYSGQLTMRRWRLHVAKSYTAYFVPPKADLSTVNDILRNKAFYLPNIYELLSISSCVSRP
jgi:hypothetical protein